MLTKSASEKGLSEEYMVMRKSSPPPFLLKTYMLVEDTATDQVVSWNSDGTGFVVWQPAEFARDLLPTLFKHSNFSSFVRQLNTYGFRKVATSRWEFCNDMFCKGKKQLLSKIRGRKSWTNKTHPIAQTLKQQSDQDHKRSKTTSSSSGYTSLVDENQRLKKENGALNSELSTMKHKCKELLGMLAMCSQTEKVVDDNKNEGPKLFGVKLQGEIRKRKREENVGDIMDSKASEEASKLQEAKMEIKLLEEKIDELEIEVEDLRENLEEAKREIAYLRKLYNHGDEHH